MKSTNLKKITSYKLLQTIEFSDIYLFDLKLYCQKITHITIFKRFLNGLNIIIDSKREVFKSQYQCFFIYRYFKNKCHLKEKRSSFLAV